MQVQPLIEMGFPYEVSRAALQKHNGDMRAAAEALVMGTRFY